MGRDVRAAALSTEVALVVDADGIVVWADELQTAKTLDEAERRRLEAETAAILSKQSLSRELAISRIREALEATGAKTHVNP